MKGKNLADELIHLYIDGAFSRRELVRRIREATGTTAGLGATLAAMGALSSKAIAQQCPDNVRVPEGADGIATESVEYPGEAGKLLGYLAKPAPDGPDPIAAIMVVHENRGLTDYIKDVTRRVAQAGFVGLGIDLLSRQGGTDQFTDPASQAQAYNKTVPAERLADMRSSVAWLRTRNEVAADRIGTVGFCAGGGNVWLVATSGETLQAYVAFYGTPIPATDQLDNLNAPILLNYAELDSRLTGTIPLAALTQKQKRFALSVYENAGHAFHNDTGPAYNRTAACDAWSKTIDFFGRHLSPPTN